MPRPFVDALASGKPLEQAVTEYVRTHAKGRAVGGMRVLCEALLHNPDTAVAGDLGYALVSRILGASQKAWYHFGRVPDDQWRKWAPMEYVRTARAIGDAEFVIAATRLLEDRPEDIPVEGWLAVAEGAFGLGRYDIARRALVTARAAQRRSARSARIGWLGDWLDRIERRSMPARLAPPTGIAFGVLDYKQPERARTSTSLDDYLQALAALGQVARYRDVEFAGPADLVQFTKSLGGRVDDSVAIDGTAGTVTLVAVNRDASSLDPLPDPTWLLAVGEYIQPWFGNIDFPFHPGIRPLFISFHCSQPDMLTPEAIEYLRRYGPVGCSDWSTVYLLHGAGVPAFFSGCISSTLGSVVPTGGSQPASGRQAAFVGSLVPRGRKGIHVPLARDEIRGTTLVANLTAALDLLDDVRHKYARVVTTSVRCYLAARSVEARTRLAAKNHADLRFNGLSKLDDGAFDAMRSGINDKLASTLSLVLSGAGEDAVYSHWRAICAGDVEEACQRISDVVPLPPPSLDVAGVCERIRSDRVDVRPSGRVPEDGAVDVTVALDGNLKHQLGVVVEALTTNCSRPLHLWVLCREHGPADFDGMARAFPEVAFTWLPCDRVDYGHVRGLLSYTTTATLDRLLLPDLLDELDRVVYIDLDVLPLGNIAELAEWDLDGAPFAACKRLMSRDSGYDNILKMAARRMGARPVQGDYLLRWLASHHTFDFPSVNAGVLVLDLARMRDENFSRNFIPFVEVYGMNDQTVLNLYGGSRHAVLPPEWNYRPSHQQIESPKLIHWAGRMKPWDQPLAPQADLWREYEAAYEARVAGFAQSLTR